MKRHQFTLILSGLSELTVDISTALYEATGGDIELNLRDGVAFLEFDRAARSLRDAITKGIQEVEGSGLGLRVIRVESEAAATIARINTELYEAITKE
jgi:hypothetical protein